MKQSNMGICAYCGSQAQVQDHFLPFSWISSHGNRRKETKRQQKGNMVSACSECNGIVNDKVFETLHEKREYVQWKLWLRYRKTLALPDWTDEQLESVGYTLAVSIKEKMKAKQWIQARIEYDEPMDLS